jgi:hypothetical protein
MTDRTDRIAQLLSTGNVPGVAVAAVFEVVSAAAGVRDVSTGAAMSPDSVFGAFEAAVYQMA